MDSSVIIAVFTVIATAFSGISLYKSLKNDKERKEIEKVQNEMKLELKKMEQGKLEIELNKLITDAKTKVLETSASIHKGDESILMNFYNSYIELELCAYDEACSLYIDEKIDKERFKKSYQVEIRNLFESEEIKTKLSSVDCKYYCLKRVYEEWENPEKKIG